MKIRAAVLPSLALVGMSLLGPLEGCKPIELGAAPTDSVVDAESTAAIAFSNRREVDANVITLNLYQANAALLVAPFPERSLGKVGPGETKSFTVPSGRWKLGYEDADGTFRPMPAGTTEGESPDWPVVTFKSGAEYQILLETDEGNHTVWRTDIPKTN